MARGSQKWNGNCADLVKTPTRMQASAAGASGEESARVFARRFEAELVAVAGVYAVADQIQNAKKGEAMQVLLQGGKLLIEPLT